MQSQSIKISDTAYRLATSHRICQVKKIPTRTFRWILGIVFLYGGIVKILSPEVYAQSVASLEWVPRAGINAIAIALPAFESACGIGLILPAKCANRVCALGTVVMLLSFLGIWIDVTARGEEFSCSCFGEDSFMDIGGNLGAILRNVLLLIMALWEYSTHVSNPSVTVLGQMSVESLHNEP